MRKQALNWSASTGRPSNMVAAEPCIKSCYTSSVEESTRLAAGAVGDLQLAAARGGRRGRAGRAAGRAGRHHHLDDLACEAYEESVVSNTACCHMS